MLYSDAVADVRSLIQDSVEGSDGVLRNSATDVRHALNNGLTAVFRMRPDAFMPMVKLLQVTEADIVNPNFVLPIDGMFAPVVVSYAASWLEMADDEVTSESRSQVLLERLKVELSGAG